MLLVDQYRHIGDQVPLGLARNATDELLANQWDGGEMPPPPEIQTAAENDASLAVISAALGGLSG